MFQWLCCHILCLLCTFFPQRSRCESSARAKVCWEQKGGTTTVLLHLSQTFDVEAPGRSCCLNLSCLFWMNALAMWFLVGYRIRHRRPITCCVMESSANSFCRTIWPGKICIPKQVPSWFWCSTASNPLLPQGGASIVWQVLARFQGCTTFQSATGHRSTDVRLKKRACTASVLQECSRCCTRPVHKAKKKGTKFTFLFVRWAFVDKDRGKQTWHAQGNLFHLEAKLGWQCICSIMFV